MTQCVVCGAEMPEGVGMVCRICESSSMSPEQRSKKDFGMKIKHYDCKFCVNRASPLCELCTQITSPSGKEHKPTYYIAQREVVCVGGRGRWSRRRVTENKETEKVANCLIDLLLVRSSLPTRIVLEYNKLVSNESNEGSS